MELNVVDFENLDELDAAAVEAIPVTTTEPVMSVGHAMSTILRLDPSKVQGVLDFTRILYEIFQSGAVSYTVEKYVVDSKLSSIADRFSEI